MNKYFKGIILACALLLTGCQLAKEKPTDNTIDGEIYEDALIGALVTKDNEEVAFNEKIYASLDSKENITFNGFDGPMFLNVDKGVVDGHVIDPISIYSGPFEVNDNQMKITDTTEEIIFEGLVSFVYDNSNVLFCVNPIYQTSEGKIYLTKGTSLSSNAGDFSQSISSERKITDSSGNEKVKSIDIKFNFKEMEAVDKYVLVQMDENHQVIQKEELIADTSNLEFTPHQQTSYIVVEKYIDNEVLYDFYDCEDEYIKVYGLEYNGICNPISIKINWK